MAANPAVQRLSHIGLCVSDLERSMVFYRDALGFTERSRLEVTGPEAEKLLALSALKLSAIYLERDGTCIELLLYDSPGHVTGDVPRPMNRLGLSHLSLRVADLPAAERAISECGGTVLTDTRIENPRFHMKAIFVLDPDGQRIELLEAPGDPSALPG